ncbi:MAG: L-histidine N(alpha)-methyltransferase [bacterium]|nr:L-histidine N(alpha)-methyltransferase [bacterium]
MDDTIGIEPSTDLGWERITLEHDDGPDLADAVSTGLGAASKTLPCHLFYDDEGSLIFEEICATPEYYPTRAERTILERDAEKLAEEFAGYEIVELGSGSAEKTELLLAAFCERGPTCYVPIDISSDALERSAARLTERFPNLSITTIEGEYEAALAASSARRSGPRLVLFLGSNIGNFGPTEAVKFLKRLRAHLVPGDALLVGVAARGDRERLEPAYNDAAGVTARFNKNILVRINRELGGTFDLDAFEHAAPYDEEAGRVAMYLVSQRAQTVRVEALKRSFTFAAGERIHTEDSYKYGPDELAQLAARGGFELVRVARDADELFALSLLRPGA